MQVNNYIF